MTEAQASYVDPSELRNSIEQVSAIETDDYLDYELIPVGNYVSQSRSVKVAQKAKNGKTYLSAEISFPAGIVGESGSGPFGGGKFPLRTWATSLTFQQQGRTGETSGLAEYLKAVGFAVKDLKTSDEILDALAESQTLPVQLYIGWTNRTEKLEDGTYSKETAKTKDFNTGSKDEPSYVPFFFSPDGKKVLARHKVASFRKIS